MDARRARSSARTNSNQLKYDGHYFVIAIGYWQSGSTVAQTQDAIVVCSRAIILLCKNQHNINPSRQMGLKKPQFLCQ